MGGAGQVEEIAWCLIIMDLVEKLTFLKKF